MSSCVHPVTPPGTPGIEMQDIGPNQPSRPLNSEAQHHASRASQAWKGFLLTIHELLSSPAARRPRGHEATLEAAMKQHPECPQFRIDYYHLCDQPCASVGSLFHLTVVRPPNIMNTFECHPSHETCLSDWLESFHGALAAESPDSFILR